MKNLRLVFFVSILFIALSSCTSVHQSMKSPNTLLELEKSDFTLSEQVSAEATSTRILGIDFQRLFDKKTGETVSVQPSALIDLASIPVIGNVIADPTANYALYELMQANTGYDVVLYPQFEVKVEKPIGLGFLMKTTTVKTTARLGKLNE